LPFSGDSVIVFNVACTGERKVNMTDKASVEAVLDKIRPALQADGGDVELVSIEDDKVKVKLTGHCAG